MAGCADDEGLAPHFRHLGRPGGLLAAWLGGEVGELADLVGFHLCAGVAPFAFAVQEPGDDLLRACGRCRWRSVMTVLRCRLSGMPPNRAASGFLPGRSSRASKQVRGPCAVTITALYLRAVSATVERCFAASVLSMDSSAARRSRCSRKTFPASR